MAFTNKSPAIPSKLNDNKQTGLAYERILLQSLIAHMSRTEPHFVGHLKERFIAPMAQVLRDHDRKTADDRGDDFIRSILRIIDRPTPRTQDEQQVGVTENGGDGGTLVPKSASFSGKLSAGRVEIIENEGTWEVRVDDMFCGDYSDMESPRVAAELARQSL